MALQPHVKLTYEDFVLSPDDGKRRELIDGEVHLSPSPVVRLQVVAGTIYHLFLSLKRDLYSRFGVAEYWIVDAEAERVEVYKLAGGNYGKPEILEPGESLKTDHLPGLEINLTSLLKP